jgi:hypothetical protein
VNSKVEVIPGAVEWTNDELRDSLREDGVDPDSLVKNVLSGIKRMNADLEKQTDIENDPDPMHQLATEFFEDFSKGVGPLGPRLQEPSKRAERIVIMDRMLKVLQSLPDKELAALLSELQAMHKK